MSLVLPLRRLEPVAAPDAAVRRTLHLDAPRAVDPWVARVREAAEACLLVDADGRVAAMSVGCGDLLALEPTAATGALLADLVDVVDSSSGVVAPDDLGFALPPLRALSDGRLARGLVRLRHGSDVCSYDVVGVPLAGGGGALGFVAAI